MNISLLTRQFSGRDLAGFLHRVVMCEHEGSKVIRNVGTLPQIQAHLRTHLSSVMYTVH